jgi:hypothetical protein
MLLTPTNICQYLIARRIISNDSVVDGAFAVIDVSRRNRNFKVFQGKHRGYFVKQIQHWDPQAVAMLQCEAACYWLARHDEAFAGLARVTPEFCSYDLERHILITRLLPDSENLHEHFRRAGRFTGDVSRALGVHLGTYHRNAGVGSSGTRHHAMFPRQIPWMLSATRRNSHPFKQLSPATSELFDQVDDRPELRNALDDLRAEWRAETLIHGDLRFENCVLSVMPEGPPAITIVDWEMVDIGDRSWDVGAILQAYLCAWMMSRRLDGDVVLPTARALAYHVFGEVGAAVGEFWDGYATALGLRGAESAAVLTRCLKFGAARLIQSAYEHVQFSSNVSPHGAYLLQLSAGILENPEACAPTLLDTRGA